MKKIKITSNFSILDAIEKARQGFVLSKKARKHLRDFYVEELIKFYLHQFYDDPIAVIAYFLKDGRKAVNDLSDLDLLTTIYNFHRDDTHANIMITNFQTNLKDSPESQNSH